MKKYLLLYILILMVPFAASAQRKNLYEKMSATTMMLMNDLQEDEEENKAFAKNVANAKLRIKDKNPKVSERFARGKHRTYAAPDTIDGKAYISSFLRVHDDARVAELQSLGVKIQSRFKNGLMTVLIPLDKIEDVASLNNVKRINVSSVAQPESDGAMEAIHADDVLKLTNNALEAGLTKKYDGKGILLAVIDVGVDFQHIAFRDSVGNLRLKGAYVYDDNGEREVTDFDELTTDNSQNDHGTHVASLAGGSRVIIDGNNVKVTNDADSASLSGVAPAADLYLCGLQDLNYTSIANALNVICNYADAHDQPLVVCGSWGSHDGPHDGTGDFADVINQYFGDDHPNRVIVFASGNYAGKSKKGDGGGFFISGNASAETPLGTIMRCNHLEGYDDGRTYDGIIASAWARSSDVDSLACRIYVLDNKTGEILASQEIRADDATSTDNQSQKCAKAQFSDYYRNDLYVYFEIDKAQKAVVRISGRNYQAKKSAVSEVNGVRLNRSLYTLAVDFYPVEGSAVIDVWGGNKSYFTNHLPTAGHDWVDGTDGYTITDESSYENGISVGAYASTNFSVDYNGVTHDVSKDYQVGEIASISSYAVPGVGPVSETLPTITAPGVLLVAAVNRYNGDSSYMSGYSYGNSSICRSNASTQHPYGSMTGTSMATPLAVGAVVLWMQAANELGKSLTVRDVKEVMQATAIHDEFTEGVNGSHFGNGKLDVLAGLQYILSNYTDTISDTIPDVKKPSLSVSADTLSFSAKLGESAAQKLKVSGIDLIDSVRVSVVDSLGVFTVDSLHTSFIASEIGDSIEILFTPKDSVEYTGMLLLSSQNADSIYVILQGIGEALEDTITDTIPDTKQPILTVTADTLSFSAKLGESSAQILKVIGTDLIDSVHVSVIDSLGVFSVDSLHTCFIASESGDSIEILFTPKDSVEYTGMLLLSSQNADSIYVVLHAIGEALEDTITDTIPDTRQPILSVSADTLSFSAKLGESAAQILKVTGTDLIDSVYVSVMDSLGVFSVDSLHTSFIASESGDSIEILFTPKDSVEYTGMLLLSSQNADSIYVILHAIGEALVDTITDTIPDTKQPILSVSEDTLSFSAKLGESATQILKVSGTDLIDSVHVSVMDSLGVFSVDSLHTSFIASESGDSIEILFMPKDSIEYSGVLLLSSQNADSIYVILQGIGEALEDTLTDTIPDTKQPILIVSADTLSFSAKLGESAAQILKVNGTDLIDSIHVIVIDSLGVFSVDSLHTSFMASETGDSIEILFTPKDSVEYTGMLLLSSQNADSIYVVLHAIGEALEDTLTDTIPDTKLPILSVSADTLSFIAKLGESTAQILRVSGTDLIDSIHVSVMDSLGVFVVDSLHTSFIASETGDSIEILFTPKDSVEYTGMLLLSSQNADSIYVILHAIGEALEDSITDTIPDTKLPILSVSADTLSFIAKLGESAVQFLKVEGIDLIDSVHVSVMDSLCVFSVDSLHTSFIASESGDSIEILFTPKDSVEYTGMLLLSSQNADSIYVILQGIGEALEDTITDTIPDTKQPILSVSSDTLSFSAKLGESASQILKVTGTDLIDSVHVSVMDSLGVFSVDSLHTSFIASETGDSIEILFTPKDSVEYAGMLLLSSQDADSIYVILHAIGEALEDTLTDTIPDIKQPILSVSVDTLSFSAKLGESVAQILKVTGTDLIDSVHVSVMDSLGVFSVDSLHTSFIASETGDSIEILFTPKDSVEYTGILLLSSQDADSIYVILLAIGEALEDTLTDTIPDIQTPILTVSADTLILETPIGVEKIEKLYVHSSGLSDSITFAIDDSLGVLTIDSISTDLNQSKADGLDNSEESEYITIHFTPKDIVSLNSVLTLSSKGAEPVSVVLICNSKTVLGDTDINGSVDITDVVTTVNYVLDSNQIEGVPIYGDMDGNGIVEITDVVLLVNKILNTSSTSDPDTPNIPDTPDNPDTPDTPENSEVPDTPDVPNAPKEPSSSEDE